MLDAFIGADLAGLRAMAGRIKTQSESVEFIEHRATNDVFQLDQ